MTASSHDRGRIGANQVHAPRDLILRAANEIHEVRSRDLIVVLVFSGGQSGGEVRAKWKPTERVLRRRQREHAELRIHEVPKLKVRVASVMVRAERPLGEAVRVAGLHERPG